MRIQIGSRVSTLASACAFLLLVGFTAQRANATPSSSADCTRDNLVIYAEGWTDPANQSSYGRPLFEVLQAYLAEFVESSYESFTFSAQEVRAESPWYRPLSGPQVMGSVVAAGLSPSQCSGGLEGAASRLRADLRARGLNRVSVIPLRGTDLRQRVLCSPHWFTYELTSVRGREPHVSEWEACQRPGTLIGSQGSLSDGSKVRFLVTNPFEVAGWCRTEADMLAEQARLKRECPGVAQVSLYQQLLSGSRAVELFGEDFFLRLGRPE